MDLRLKSITISVTWFLKLVNKRKTCLTSSLNSKPFLSQELLLRPDRVSSWESLLKNTSLNSLSMVKMIVLWAYPLIKMILNGPLDNYSLKDSILYLIEKTTQWALLKALLMKMLLKLYLLSIHSLSNNNNSCLSL